MLEAIPGILEIFLIQSNLCNFHPYSMITWEPIKAVKGRCFVKKLYLVADRAERLTCSYIVLKHLLKNDCSWVNELYFCSR